MAWWGRKKNREPEEAGCLDCEEHQTTGQRADALADSLRKASEEACAAKSGLDETARDTNILDELTRKMVHNGILSPAQGRGNLSGPNPVITSVITASWNPDTPHDIAWVDYIDGAGRYHGAAMVAVHPPTLCEGRLCNIHQPSANHMREWPMLWNKEKNTMFRKCEHGVWHPDFDHLSYTEKRFGEQDALKQASHNCDTCCERMFL